MNLLRKTTGEQRIYLAAALMGAVISLLDFAGVIDWPADILTKMVLLAISMLLLAVVTQATQQQQATESVERRLRQPLVEYIDLNWDVPSHFSRNAERATRFIHEAILTWYVEQDQTPRDGYRNKRDERVIKGQVDLRQIVIIHHQKHFKEVLGMIARFEHNAHYTLRYYDPYPAPMSAINYWSFDDEHIYAGSLYPHGSGSWEEMLYSHGGKLNNWFVTYWDALWQESRGQWLKQGNAINYSKLKEIGERLGINEAQYESLLENYRTASSRGSWQDAELVVTRRSLVRRHRPPPAAGGAGGPTA